ncbi:Glycoside hydrolase family 5 protein [Mycena indigotica]|uniref:glucan 1,3-beta-glucosidase n=1 Tax=Mycena indigotica TaxID=2126181 RepID=A0A8H6W5E6_9AGAR|nr:Glycoside hydrolase family 5 protein [Mycena indigotica]KAF7306449.1 Glycoside hydrolase family 5 protein [Mycena indigotica]
MSVQKREDYAETYVDHYTQPLTAHIPVSPLSPHFAPYLDSPLPSQQSFRDEDYAYPPPPSPSLSNSPYTLSPPPSPGRPVGKERVAYAASQGGYGYGGPTAHRRSMMMPSVNQQQQGRRRKRLIMAGGLLFLMTAVVLVVVIISRRRSGGSNASATSASSSDSDNRKPSSKSLVTTGGDQSVVVNDFGDTFVYTNSFGGYWLADPENPTYGGRANSWTPLLNETWTWGVNRANGVNLGGWFQLEPFISPALFQPYPSAGDEWTLSQHLLADGKLESTLETHYATFITEQDLAQIAGAGLNWIRVPIPFWAVGTWSDVGTDAFGTGANGGTVAEPFLNAVCWKYFVRMLGWARKYGLRVNIDLHSLPGSQNGYNHSGKMGQINFLNGPMGMANAQRALDCIRVITEFIAQEQYQDVVQIFGVVNEALMSTIGREQLGAFYIHTHDMIRGITGIGKGPYISLHDGFVGLESWAGFATGSDRIILDTHPYFSFSGNPNNAPIATSENPLDPAAGGTWPNQACSGWGGGMNSSRGAFGVTLAGEFSNGFNDCGLFLKGVNGSTSYGGDCNYWQDASQWNTSVKAGLQAFALGQMDALQDWFFWTWKIGAAQNGVVSSPLWSYKAGLEGGWMPADPRVAVGKCIQVGATPQSWAGTFSSWQTGGAGAGNIQSRMQWPPATLSNQKGNILLTYTPTAAITSLMYVMPTVTPTGSASASVASMPSASMGSGWANLADTTLAAAPIAGCTYPNAWNAIGLPAPTVAC